MDIAERLKGSELDHRPYLILEQDRQNDNIQWRCLAQTRADGDVVRRYPGNQNGLLLKRTLAYQRFTQLESVGNALALAIGVGIGELQNAILALAFHQEKGAVMAADQRGEL